MAHRDIPVTDYRSVVDEDTQFIDVRQPDEVAAGTLDDVVNIPLGHLADRIGELDPALRTVVLCRSGNRSTQACEFMTASGFVDVVNLAGGMLAYNEEHGS